jgi:hypothetical protein
MPDSRDQLLLNRNFAGIILSYHIDLALVSYTYTEIA